jgi:hypothetical protein
MLAFPKPRPLARGEFCGELQCRSTASLTSQLGQLQVTAWNYGTTEALNQLREVEHLIDRDVASGFRNNASSLVYHALGHAALLLGRLDEARSLGDRSLKYGRSNHAYAAHALHLLGDIATHPERFDVESGETYYRQALALAEPRGMRPLIAQLGLAKLYQRTDRPGAGS